MIADANAALGISAKFLEFSFAASTSMDLAFDHPYWAGKGCNRAFGLVKVGDCNASCNGRTKCL